MMERKAILIAALVAAFAISCRENGPAPRPTVPLVTAVASDTSGLGLIAARAGHIGENGHIALLGERQEGIYLARRFQSADRMDNIDGRPVRDSLLDFAGETFDVIMDAYNEPYASFLADSVGIDSLRECAVRGALFAWDSLSQAKILVFTSSLHARYGYFDVDTLQQLTGGTCRLMTPVHESLKAAVAGGAKNIAVWASDPVREAGVYESVFEELGLEGNVISITPDSALDICTEFRSLLRQYRLTGRKLDALIMDGYGKDPAPLWSEIPIIRRAATEEEEAFSAMLPQNFQILDPGSCIVDAVYSLLRKENLFTHHIHRTSVRYFVTEESIDGGLQKVPLSAQYVQSEYVPNLN
ncbi:MAG: hypothetical protein IK052_04255 [Bacteroidales bacterium]|nr:hypothetical protein [Bacteroidales bacterium]